MFLWNKIIKHNVIRNAIALAAMQISNYIVPLLLLPFLTRKLGVETFGVVVITLAIIQFAFVITDYGFSLSATYDISINRDDFNYINNKISAIFGAKLILVFIVGVGFLFVDNIFSIFSDHLSFLAVAFIAVFAQAFMPIWLFQGIERMKNITIYTVISKLLYAISVLFLVDKPVDAIVVIYCWSGAQVIGLLFAFYYIYLEGYKVLLPSWCAVKKEFLTGAQFFWSRLAVSIYTSVNILIVGNISVYQAAQYSVCEQIYKAGQNATSPINNAIYPYMAKHKNWKFFYKLVVITGLSVTMGCSVLFFLSEWLLCFLFGDVYVNASPILKVFLLTSIINYFAVTFGYPVFAALGRVRIANLSVIVGAFFHIINLCVQFFYFEVTALNIAITVLITEFIVMIIRLSFFVYFKNKINI